MSWLFLLKKFLAFLLLPPFMPLLVMATGLLLLRKSPRLGLGLAWSGVLLGLAFIQPTTVGWMTAPLEQVAVIKTEELSRAQAIVILGAGQRRDAPEYGGPTTNRLGLERLRYGARLAKVSGLPVLVTGGAPKGFTAEATLMADVLKQDFGVAAKWVEDHSLDTADNARLSAEILKSAGVKRIVLVTHAAHMRRSVAEFQAHGLDVSPAPTAFFTDNRDDKHLFDYLPGATSAYAGWYALHEWIGLLAQKIRMTAEDF